MFVIEDELHAETIGENYLTLEDAKAELLKLSQTAWDESPNKAPCENWKTCGRKYEIAEYDTATTPWKELRRIPMLQVDAKGVVWNSES